VSRAVSSIAAAYSATGGAWQSGPGQIYDTLAQELVDRCPGGVSGRRVLDIGAGTGAASRAATAAGAGGVVAVDVATGMLLHDASSRPPAVTGDALALPFPQETFGAVVAAFSLNHLTDPASGLAEAGRVLRGGGGLIASAYALDDTHPAKAAVEAACRDAGWTPEPWYLELRNDAIPRLATEASAAEVASVLPGAEVATLKVSFPGLTPADLVAWRLGMAQVAAFVGRRTPSELDAIGATAVELLGPRPPALVRSCITITWRRPG